MTTIFGESRSRVAETAGFHASPAISGIFVWTCGVLLPLASIVFEAITGVCTTFIDPMPTMWHLAVLLTVPVCNVLAWRGLKSDSIAHDRWFARMSGYSLAVSLFYTILFIPIMPMAFVGLLALLPVLAFGPALSLWTALRLTRSWKDLVGGRQAVLGFACGAAVLVLLAWPAIGVRAAAELAESHSGWARELGYHVLRLDGVREELLAVCHSRNGGGAVESIAYLTGRGPLTPATAQLLYYRVTGRAYEQEPETTLAWRHRAWGPFDAHRGGDRVGPVGEGVRLNSSRLDGVLDARSAVGYFEWTMVFRNSSDRQQEARMEMALPKGGVVSRATLWVHGEEREAAFGARGRVRQAYQSVVSMRRDPLLVTSSGPDRVLVQCFPIEPAGEMKIRVGITAPVMPEQGSDGAAMALPTLISQNFDAAEPAWVWIEPKSSVAPPRLRAGERAVVRLDKVNFGTTWAQESEGKAVEQRFVERTVNPPSGVVVVVDASESMRGMRDEIRAALETIPKSVNARVVTVGEWRGGVDAVPAIEEALAGPVLWVAGEQPVRFAGTERIRQVLERGAGRGRLAVLSTGGTNLILRDLEGLPGVETVPRVGSAGEDLRRFVARWRAPYPERVVERRLVAADAVAKEAAPGSSHIVRLWAAGQPAAVAIAHQVVTPLTGAVVLETAQQYVQNGLEPGSPSRVPTMPEPETVGLIAVGLAVLGWYSWRRRSCLPGRESFRLLWRGRKRSVETNLDAADKNVRATSAVHALPSTSATTVRP
jgi:hypothetical protein